MSSPNNMTLTAAQIRYFRKFGKILKGFSEMLEKNDENHEKVCVEILYLIDERNEFIEVEGIKDIAQGTSDYALIHADGQDIVLENMIRGKYLEQQDIHVGQKRRFDV